MAFIWQDTPSSPPVPLPVPVGADKITFKVHEVANTVNAGGQVSYNTPNTAFDVFYELASMNVRNLNVTNLNTSHGIINTAMISTASINVANINVANITNVRIQYGFMGGSPSSNLEIATKEYVDAASANVPTGGSDLETLIDAPGDLLVGISANTLARLPVGTFGQVLTVDNTSTTGLRWKTVSGVTSFSGVHVGTHDDPIPKLSQILLRRADGIVMNDGDLVTQWSDLLCDITTSGAGGLDTGTEVPSQWYEVYAIRNNALGTRSLLLHRTEQTKLNQFLITTSDTARDFRRATAPRTLLAQSFIPSNTGPLTSLEIELSKTGSPSGLVWVTIETSSGGFPSGTPLATSRVMDVSRLPTDKGRVRFLFDANTSVTLGTTYNLVYWGNYALSDTNYTTVWGVLAGAYANGSATEFHLNTSSWNNSVDVGGGPADLWFKVFIQETPKTAVVMPTGYDQRSLISYVYNDSDSNFKGYAQLNHSMVMGVSTPWRLPIPITGLLETLDLEPFVPPVPSVVQFICHQIGIDNRTIYIGGAHSTDLPLGNGSSGVSGSISGNLVPRLLTAGVGGLGEIIVENQLLLTRMKNVESRLYVSIVNF